MHDYKYDFMETNLNFFNHFFKWEVRCYSKSGEFFRHILDPDSGLLTFQMQGQLHDHYLFES